MEKITFSQKRKVLNQTIEALLKRGLKVYENVDAQIESEFLTALLAEINCPSYPDNLLISKYYKTLMNFDIGFCREIQKTLSTDRRSFERYVALMERNIETSENIRAFNAKDSKEEKKVNVTLYYSDKECYYGFEKMLKGLHQASKIGFKEVYLNGYFIYIVQDSFARKTTKVIHDACVKFFGKALVGIAYRKESTYLEAFNYAWQQSPILVDDRYPIFMYFDKYEVLRNHQTMFTKYRFDRVLEKNSYCKGWVKKHNLGQLDKVEELFLEDGFGVPQRDVKRVTIVVSNVTKIIYFFKEFDDKSYGEPHLLINYTDGVNQYLVGLENIKNYLS